MANPEHLVKLLESVSAKNISVWNDWLRQDEEIDLSETDLSGLHLSGVDLVGAILDSVNFSNTNLTNANLLGASLVVADFTDAILRDADLQRVNLMSATLFQADLTNADIRGAQFRDRLDGAIFSNAWCAFTVFSNSDLSKVKGLEIVRHSAPSTIGIDTLYKSRGNIPEVFLRGCGVPEDMIEFAKSLRNKNSPYYSAFISYSAQDKDFAFMLHEHLRENRVRVWIDKADLRIGETIEDSIEQAIRTHDKVILVLSKNSIDRAWVKKEFSKAMDKEQQHGKTVLFPIRLDDSVFETNEQWAYDIRKRHIGDFRNWTNPLLYQNAINRLLRDLNADSKIPSPSEGEN